MQKYKEYYDLDKFLEVFSQKAKLLEKGPYYSTLKNIEDIISKYRLDKLENMELSLSKLNKIIAEVYGKIIENLNQIILEQREGIYYLLKNYLNASPEINWQEVISKLQRKIPTPQEPKYPSLPPQPEFSWWYGKLFPNKKRKKLEEWNRQCQKIKKEIENLRNEYRQKLALWEKKQKEIANKILNLKNNFQKDNPSAIETYFQWVIEKSPYPWKFQKKFDLFFNQENKTLLVEFVLPKPEDIPQIKEIKYIKTRRKVQIIYFKEKELTKLYERLIYQIALKTIYELFAADTKKHLDSIVFNGKVDTLDRRTGRPIKPCIISVHTKREVFFEINIKSIDPKECFRYLKGIGSSKLHLFTPIPPIMQITKQDDRFTEGYSVIDNINEGYNVAAMDWLDFENLIRELFEKEFCTINGEVKITRASRDRGVDAIVFDPDPIRGGKIVLQAKRYTNNVDVSAVRDLYGTVVNEGATKGILITTSDFGPDAYEFAKDKPITLINGAGLLYLLEKHGYKAYINLEEAKKQIKKEAKKVES